ncbi:YceI family protein (plasmid) [Pedobacter sp. BS3]|uniref:YceI family protein n=1 Tax=Pedobacter sp. BS3 TaxID=2567937 RepID=UPI0011ECEAE3|nr:YceI family protein [Pedobacter sp. BS3]TZF86244.1 YceI family protein [Pedobacter sp. BS3]
MKSNQTNRQGSRRLFALLVIILSAAQLTFGQGVAYKAGGEIKVLGTSNLHDWDMKAQTFTCDAQFTFKAGELSDISQLDFTLPVKNLKSKETSMDGRAYKALKAEQFNKISFKLNTADVSGQTIKATGNLTIAGVTKNIALNATARVNADGSVTCTGSKKIKMTDFKIEPPTFMMGALKTGDEVTIEFALKFNK